MIRGSEDHHETGLEFVYQAKKAATEGTSILEVLKMIFNFVLGPPSPGGSRGRVRTAIFLKKS